MSNRKIKEIELGDHEVFDIRDKEANDRSIANKNKININTNKITEIENKMYNISFNKNTKFLFLADSYDDYSGWIDKTANKLGLEKNVDYWNLGLSGSSFSDGRWLTQIQDWYSRHSDIANQVGHVICGGGINDSGSTVASILAPAMQTFSAWVHANLPNAQIQLSWFGYGFDNSAWVGDRIAKHRAIANMLWSRAEGFGMTYMPGSEMVLHDRSLMDDDNLHPNPEGGNRISECVANQIVNGSCNVTNSGEANVIQGGGTIEGSIKQIIFNNINTIIFDSLKISNTSGIPWRFENGAYIDVAVCYLPYGYRMYPERRMLNFRKSDNTIVTLNALIQILDNKLQIAIHEFEGAYFKAIDCIAIENMNFINTIAGIID